MREKRNEFHRKGSRCPPAPAVGLMSEIPEADLARSELRPTSTDPFLHVLPANQTELLPIVFSKIKNVAQLLSGKLLPQTRAAP